MQRYPPGFNPEVTITGYNDDVHPHPTKFNDIYAIPDRSPAVRRYPVCLTFFEFQYCFLFPLCPYCVINSF